MQAVAEIQNYNEITNCIVRKKEIIDRVIKRQKQDKNDVIELAKVMEQQYRLEGNERKISGICAEIRDIYQKYEIDRYYHVDRDLKDYPQYKRKYNSGSPYENEMQSLGNDQEEEQTRTRQSLRSAEEKDNQISEAIEYAIEELNKFRIVMRKYPPESYLHEHCANGFRKLGEFFNLMNDDKSSQDALARIAVARKMIISGVSTGRKEDMIIVNICASCSRMVKQNQHYQPMKFHDVLEIKDPHNDSIMEVLYKVWRCPECHGFDRMEVPLSREHVANNWQIGITYAEELLTWMPSFIEAITAYRRGKRGEVGIRKLCTVSVFQNA